MIFDAEQIRAVKQGRITAVLIPASQHVTTGRVRNLRKRIQPAEGDDAKQTVRDVVNQNPQGDPIPTVITVLEVRRVDLLDLAFADARACGYKTTDELREAWRAIHPRTANVQLVTFAIGDVRDRPRFLAHTRHFRAGIQGDFTVSRSRAADDAEVLDDEVLERYTTRAIRKHVAIRGDEIAKQRLRSLAIRLKEAARQGPDMPLVAEIRGEIEAIERETTLHNRLAG